MIIKKSVKKMINLGPQEDKHDLQFLNEPLQKSIKYKMNNPIRVTK